MFLGKIFSGADISATGMAAERLRMEVVANNIANANSTRTPQGGPFRRQNVIFSEVLGAAGQGDGAAGLGGVRVMGITDAPGELPTIHQPGHPDADPDGYVTLPNVQIPNEMVDLITASRAYEANLRALRSFREMAEQSLTLLRGA